MTRGAVFATLAVLVAVVAAMWTFIGATSPAGQAVERAAVDAPSESTATEAELHAAMAATHPNYAYSVIPGGAHSPQQLLDAIGRDDVVAAHYRLVSPERVRVESLTEERRAYVSYRVGDRIFWTKNKVTLPAGEAILTDGVTQIRARCGNCISYEPQLPTSDEEPDAIEFEALSPPASHTTASLATTALPPVSSVRMPGQSLVTSGGGSGASGGRPSTRSETSGESGASGGSGGAQPGWRFLATDSDLSAMPTQDPDPESTTPNLLLPLPIPIPEQQGTDRPIPGDPTSGGLPSGGPGAGGPGAGAGPGTPFPGGLVAGGEGPGATNPGGPAPGDLLPQVPPVDTGFGTEPVQPAPIPEPSTLVLLGTGAAGALWRRVRSRRRR